MEEALRSVVLCSTYWHAVGWRWCCCCCHVLHRGAHTHAQIKPCCSSVHHTACVCKRHTTNRHSQLGPAELTTASTADTTPKTHASCTTHVTQASSCVAVSNSCCAGNTFHLPGTPPWFDASCSTCLWYRMRVGRWPTEITVVPLASNACVCVYLL